MAAPSDAPPAPRGDWFSDLFGFAETSYDEARNWLRLHPGEKHGQPAMLESLANKKQFSVGMFSTPTLAELRKEGAAAKEAVSSLPDAALTVRNELGDVSAKHTQADNRHATFQVASQFNCLEFVGPSVVPEDGVTRYISDRTQGPACSITCGPATVFRNYFAPVDSEGGCKKGQTRSSQLDNLSEVSKVVGNVPAGRLFDTKGGYTLARDAQLRKLDSALARLAQQDKLDDVRAALRVGVHSDVQVTSCKWGSQLETDPGQLVTQVFASACSVAYNSNSESRNWKNFASIILEAAYEATLWAALLNAHRHGGAHGSRQVFLTCVGGGVFGNSMEWIAQAMRRAFNQFKDCSLDVRIVTYAGQINPHLVALEEEFSACPVRIRELKQKKEDATSLATPMSGLPKEASVVPAKRKAADQTPSVAVSATPMLGLPKEASVVPDKKQAADQQPSVAVSATPIGLPKEASVAPAKKKQAVDRKRSAAVSATPMLAKEASVAPAKKQAADQKPSVSGRALSTRELARKLKESEAPSQPAVKRGRGQQQQQLEKSGESTPKAKSRKTERSSAIDGATTVVTPAKADKADPTKTAPSSTHDKPNGVDTTTTTSAPFVATAGQAKKGRGKGKRTAKPAVAEGVALDASILQEAEGLGFAGALKNLAARPEIVSSGATAQAMLNALKEHDGLVNVAKHALLKA